MVGNARRRQARRALLETPPCEMRSPARREGRSAGRRHAALDRPRGAL